MKFGQKLEFEVTYSNFTQKFLESYQKCHLYNESDQSYKNCFVIHRIRTILFRKKGMSRLTLGL